MHVAGLGLFCVGLVDDVVLAKQRKFPDSPLLLNPGLFFRQTFVQIWSENDFQVLLFRFLNEQDLLLLDCC